MSKRTFYLKSEAIRRNCQEAVWDADEGDKVTISPPSKSREQEEKYHAQIGDIAKQWRFCDRLWDVEDMKRLCLDQFRRDTIKDPAFADAWARMGHVAMAPSIDKSGVVALGIQSRKFGKVLGSGFIEWLYALGAEVGVRWSEPKAKSMTPAQWALDQLESKGA